MRFYIAFCLVLLAAIAADAGIFEWVDSEGVTHFTDNPENIPAKYQKKVKVRESAPVDGSPAVPATSPAPPPPESKVVEEQRLRGGHDEWWWRAGFSEIRRELDGIQGNLAGKREQLSTLHRKRVIYQKARDRVAYNELDDGIKQDEARVKELEDRLVALEAEADRADVPQEWRR